MINKISDEKREQIANASAKTLPNNPTGRGMTADEIRKRLWEPITASKKSLADEIDRVVDEAKTEIGNLETEIKDEASARKTADSEHDRKIAENETAINDLEKNKVDENDVSSSADANTIAKRTSKGTLVVNVSDNDGSSTAVNKGYMQSKLDEITSSFQTQIEGKSRTFVIADINTLNELLSGRWEMGSETYYDDYLRTGDTILCIDTDLPDFWFERTTDTSRVPETFVYTDESGNERTITLRVRGYDNGGTQVGLLHILESNAVNFGDLEAVLDSIIAYQEQLIGGDA